MKKKIVFYSKTGNTKGIAEKIHGVSNIPLEAIIAASDDPNQAHVELIEKPDLHEVERIIFGSPVHGFSTPKVVKAYLEDQPTFEGKTFDLFVTHFFPCAWMGGNQVLKQMEKIILAKGGKIHSKTSINWKSKKREIEIYKLIEKFRHTEEMA